MGRHGTIAGRKAAQDSKRAAMFTKYTRAIIVAAKAGGDPDYNATLRVAIEKAKAIGMPNDNIKRAIKKGTGELAGESYEELSFEMCIRDRYIALNVSFLIELFMKLLYHSTIKIEISFHIYIAFIEAWMSHLARRTEGTPA